MEYMSPQEASKKWDIGLRRVQCFCSEDRIPGVIKIGRQWLIPINAQKPEDCRKKGVKQSHNADVYRFPIFVYSDCYVARSGLTEDETMLLNAQISIYKCNYTHGISECRKLTSADHPEHIIFGAYCTILYGSIVLGLYSEVVHCMDILESLQKQNPDNEDYKLIITALKFQYSFNCDEMEKIDPDKLSPDALILYQVINIQTLVFNKNYDCNIIEHLSNSLCCQLKSKGISTAVILIYGVMALYYQRNGNTEKMKYCIDEVCRIGHDEGFLKLLTKCSSLSSGEYRTSLLKYGTAFADKIAMFHQQNIIGFQTIFSANKNEPYFKDCTPEENEIMLLLSYDFSNKSIAEIKNKSLVKTNNTIESLRKRYHFETRKELVNYTKRMFNNDKA